MRKKCQTCLCCTCIHICDDCKNCHKENKKCNWYSGCRQLNFFESPPGEECSEIARRKWSYYGISKKRYKELTAMMRNKEYAALTSQVAHTAVPDIAEYILLSVNKNLSYEGLETLWQLREIERMACCRTDFYGYRRYFYYLFDKEIRKCGKN